MKYKVNDPDANDERNGAIEMKQESIFSWQYGPRNEKELDKNRWKLIIIVGILMVIVIALLLTVALQMVIFRKEVYDEMCQSEECVRTGTIKSRFPLSSFSTLFPTPTRVSLAM